jgi:hypothetical protein
MSVPPFVRQAPSVALVRTVSQITDLTEIPFPENFAEYEEAGVLRVEDEMRDTLSNYLAFHGLCLPLDADADAVSCLENKSPLGLRQQTCGDAVVGNNRSTAEFPAGPPAPSLATPTARPVRSPP